MRVTLGKALEKLRDFWAGLDGKERRRLVLLLCLVVLLSVSAAVLLGRTTYGVLYGGLTPGQAGEVIAALEELGVPYRTGGSSSILVPQERVTELKMKLEYGGINGGDFDYSLIDKASGFGATDAEKQTYLQYQLGAHLRTTILMMEKVENCLVIVNLAKASSFALSEHSQPSSASVMVQVRGGGRLSESEASAIAGHVLTGVPGITAENISITDTKMNVYRHDAGDGTELPSPGGQWDLTEQVRASLERQVVSFLSPVFGAGAVQASVGVSLNFDGEVVRSVAFEPPTEGAAEGLAVSLYELYESTRTEEGAVGVPGTDSSGMGTVQYPYDDLSEEEGYRRIVREVNYELNETRTEVEKAKGTIKNLSVAVLIDSQSMAEEDADRVQELVARAVGVEQSHVSVQRLPFQSGDELSGLIDRQNDVVSSLEMRKFLQEGLKYAVLLVLGILVFLLGRSVLALLGARRREGGLAYAGGPGQSVDYLTQGGAEESEDPYPELDISARSDGIRNLEKFIDRDPEGVSQLLRNWLSDEF